MKYITPTVYLFFISTLLLLSDSSKAGDSVKISRSDYIASYKDDAIRDMKKTGVPASITLAQALLESDDGNSKLAHDANNHFGVKCSDWTGDTYIQDDDHKDECFRKYKSVLESYDDHSNFLRTRPRYAALFQLPVTDYIGWANGLKSAGYATNPHYADQLIKIIEDNSLFELDRGNDLPVIPQPIAATATSKPASSAEASATPTKHVLSGVEAPKVFFSPATSDVVNPYGRHEVLKNNGVPYVLAKANDDYKAIADEFEMNTWQIYKYNEIDKHTPIKEGQRIYLKPKKRQGDETSCIVEEGQTLNDIAQVHGVKLRLLKKWNNLSDNSEVTAGQKILLKKH